MTWLFWLAGCGAEPPAPSAAVSATPPVAPESGAVGLQIRGYVLADAALSVVSVVPVDGAERQAVGVRLQNHSDQPLSSPRLALRVRDVAGEVLVDDSGRPNRTREAWATCAPHHACTVLFDGLDLPAEAAHLEVVAVAASTRRGDERVEAWTGWDSWENRERDVFVGLAEAPPPPARVGSRVFQAPGAPAELSKAVVRGPDALELTLTNTGRTTLGGYTLELLSYDAAGRPVVSNTGPLHGPSVAGGRDMQCAPGATCTVTIRTMLSPRAVTVDAVLVRTHEVQDGRVVENWAWDWQPLGTQHADPFQHLDVPPDSD